jgi:hypothetical protein
MRGSITYLRRGLLGAAIAGSLGFGATQALAVPREAVSQDGHCNWGHWAADPFCRSYCQSKYYMDGTCSQSGFCTCTTYIEP